MKFSNIIQQLQELHPVFYSILAALILLAAAWLSTQFVKLLLLCGLRKLFKFLPAAKTVEYPLCVSIITNAINIIPAAFLAAASPTIPGMAPEPGILLRNIAISIVILFAALTISKSLDLTAMLYKHHPHASTRPIKGYLQLLKICLGCIAFILIIAALINKNPLLLLSGIGAMAAIIILIFQDTILSVVASLQLTSDDMIRLGDWIEMPSLNTDGNIVEIALHTIKVRNWDNTISTIPVRKLITDSFKNWRGMVESGGRRIKRSIFIDQRSIRFLQPPEIQNLKNFMLLQPYLTQKEQELAVWNREHPSVNGRHLTNIGTFRAYVVNYLRNNPAIHQGMTLLVRQLPPGATGIPLEIYCFTQTVDWNPYEDIQSDIFDHLLAILPQFDLRVFQECSDTSGIVLHSDFFGINK